MEYKLVYNGGKVVTKSSGCWGACGRLDQYNGNSKELEAINAFTKKNFSKEFYSSGYNGAYFAGDSGKGLEYVRLDVEKGWGKLFHISNAPLLEYIIDRSPLKPCFNVDFNTAYTNNSLDVNVHSVPNQVSACALIWLRDICYYTGIGATFSLVKGLGFDDGVSFCTAMLCRGLYKGEAPSQHKYLEATGHFNPAMFNDEPTLATWDKYCHIYPGSCVEVGGYMTVLQQMFEPTYQKILFSICSYGAAHTAHRVNTRVQGIFGPINFNGVVDIKAYVKTLWGLK